MSSQKSPEAAAHPIAALVAENVASIRPYIPGKPIEELERELGISGAIKLASNENALGPPRSAIEAMRKEASEVHFYPEGGAPELRRALARHLGVTAAEIIVGNGSNELLELVLRAFSTRDHHAVFSQRAFLVYPLVCKAADVAFTAVPMTDDFRHDLPAMAAAVRDNTRLVFIANPNNPTGTYNTHDELARFLETVPDHLVVVMDEAYFEYVDADDYADSLALRGLHPNLLVTRTFSKCYALAGLRVGYGIGPEAMIDYMHRVRQPFNSNRMAQAAAVAALGDAEYVEYSIRFNNENRAALQDALDARGIDYLPSVANFVLIDVERPCGEVVDALMRRGVIVRGMTAYEFPNHIRVTVGTSEQNARFLKALDEVLAG
jgi:histidinol-phosphate aminotransferase